MKKKPFSKLGIDKQIKLINKALEKDVLPMLMSHGGGLEIMDIEGWKIIIQYFGACHGCPLASSGTLEFIEQTLRGAIDERIVVVPA
jgi:Fe-S cluster biogenesis protein NfuA